RRVLQLAELRVLPAARLHPAVDLAQQVRVRHARVLEEELGVLVEAPAALVEYFSDAQSRCIAGHGEYAGAGTHGSGGIGTHVGEDQLADVRVGDVALAAVQYPLVAAPLRSELQTRARIVGGRQSVVGAGVGLG